MLDNLDSLRRAISYTEQDQRVGKTGDAKPDTPLGMRLLFLLRQRKA